MQSICSISLLFTIFNIFFLGQPRGACYSEEVTRQYCSGTYLAHRNAAAATFGMNLWESTRAHRTLSQRTQFKYRYVWIGEKNSNLRCCASAAVHQRQKG